MYFRIYAIPRPRHVFPENSIGGPRKLAITYISYAIIITKLSVIGTRQTESIPSKRGVTSAGWLIFFFLWFFFSSPFPRPYTIILPSR